MEINDIVHGFRLLKKTYIPEVVSTAYEFKHEKSGARLLFLENKDDNKVFSIAFRTPPHDDTGVAHIVEHSVLCGSRKYPLKEPFVELAKGSLNTFLNAMTFPDKTMYPIASQNDKDFQNLMDVYLDAVFYPAMYNDEDVLRQEGWHYEIENAADPLTYSGVVYNEMKGALSSPDDLLETEILKALFPDTTYAKESGGNPEHIPELTQEMFVDFHRRYYHPSNSYVFLYGDLNIEEKLEYLDREYFSAFSVLAVDSEIKLQPAFSARKVVEKYYPIGAEESSEGKTFLSLNYVIGESVDVKKNFCLTVLTYALLQMEAAPLRQAIIDAGIGKDVSASLEGSVRQPYLSIVVQNAEPEQAEQFAKIVDEKLKELVSQGIDRELLQAAFNVIEFKLRESDFGQYPKGLMYNIGLLNTWLYDADPLLNLYYEDLLKEVQTGLSDGLFEQMIQETLIDNPHQVLLSLCPDKDLAAEREEKLKAELAVKKDALDEAAVQEIIGITAALKRRQQTEDSPEALATIPLLSIADIKKEPSELPLDVRNEHGTKVLFSDIATGGISYLTFYFDAAKIPQEKLPYAFLLEEIISAVATNKYSYAKVAKLLNLLTGGLSCDLVPVMRDGEPDKYDPRFLVRMKVLSRKLPEAMELLTEILTGSLFTDKKRLSELVAQSRAAMELDILRKSHQVMNQRLVSYLTPGGMFAEQGNLEYFRFVCELNDNFADRFETLSKELADLLPLVFNANGLIVSLTSAEKDYPLFVETLGKLQASLPDRQYPAARYYWDVKAKNEGLMSSSQVQYVGKAANFIKLGYKYTGVMQVLSTIMRYDYLWTKIRVQGGAYGAFSTFTPVGTIFFGSYRDPNLQKTLTVFDNIASYLREFSASEREMTKYIIGTMSGIDMPLTPKMKGARAAEAYLRGVSYELRKQRRLQILSTTQDDIKKLAELVDTCMKANILCVFGNEKKVKENAAVFGTLTRVMG